MKDWSLISGPLPVTLTVLAVLALAALVVLRPWKWSLLTLLVCALVVYAGNLYVERIWKPFPDPLDFSVLAWSWAALSAIALAVQHLVRKRWYTPILGLIVVIGASVGGNAAYGYYPDVGTALGLKGPSLSELKTDRTQAIEVPSGGYLADVWKPPPGLPAKGSLAKHTIPGTVSGFKAREGFIYLPPGYQVTPRPILPVLVVLSGQPGAPQMWIDGGQIVEMMDRYAAAHGGLAPVVLLPDVLGSDFGNTLCVDSARGNVETYLAKDIPAWVKENLQAATDPKSWAISGLSFGGTCALQLALRAPDVYGRFINLSGDRELEFHGKQGAIDEYFGGDRAAYARHNPPDLLAQNKFPDTAARLVVGRDDGEFTTSMRLLRGELAAAGADVDLLELPGGHSWSVWRPGLEQSLPWLAIHTRLSR
ncbi:MAG TPA: esterase [Micromonosporaceae bacterium]|nr:esterase [Micromonosporaceae bacterium]HCU51032.1 esterase [Micromonosporaceae bacterium]